MGVPGQRERADRGMRVAQRGEAARQRVERRRHAGVFTERRRVLVDARRQLPHVAHLLRLGDAGDVGRRRARPAQLAQRRRRAVDQPDVLAQFPRRLRHQPQPADEALERLVDAHGAGERQPGVAARHAERQPGDDLDFHSERRSVQRELLVLGVQPPRPSADPHQPLAPEVEPETVPAARHLRVREPVHTFAVRPRRAQRQRRAVERPGLEVRPLARHPGLELRDPGLEPVESLRVRERHVSPSARRPRTRRR